MFSEPTLSLDNYDSRPFHKAFDEIWLDPSGDIHMATSSLDRRSPRVQKSLEN